MKLAATAFKLRNHGANYLGHITRWRPGIVCPNVVRVSGGDRMRESNYNGVSSFGASGLQDSMCDGLMRFTVFMLALWLAVAPCDANGVSAAKDQKLQNVLEGIKQSCHDCHNSVTNEGGVSFEDLGDLSQNARYSLLNRAQEQLFFGLMPPEESGHQQSDDHTGLADAISILLKTRGVSELDERSKQPGYGNYVDHEKLFSGEVKKLPFSPSRRWLVSPQIFHERVNDVFLLEGRERQREFYGVTNPIVLPDNSGVRYFDTGSIDGGHLLMMLANADWISKKQIFSAENLTKDRSEISFENQKDRWYPPRIPDSFVKIVSMDAIPTRADMTAAIESQFICVLQRKPNERERTRYLELMSSSIEIGGNREGLRQMLVSVLLESEFLYRTEFGAGENDEHGRKKLSGREASYAIAYALSDRGPDAELKSAAESGRLETRADYRKQVTRILDDKNSFFGEVSPTVSSGYVKPHRVSHPKIVRFFRDFFGYPNSMKLFKDMARSGGFFDNAGRDYTGTAGSVTNEADRVVGDIVARDKNVFEQLLTTDEFYVLHPHSNQEAEKIIEDWRKAYAVLRNLDWRSDPAKALEDNFEAHRESFKAIRITKLTEERQRVNVRDFKRFMEYFEQTFDRGITPITFPWFYHGGQKFRYSEIYSLPRVPGGGPIGSSGKYRKELAWDYPAKQPFKIANRKGILTHPAWLLAHSQNTETDIVRRGRWIREKLLAGCVPDVPISVDAQIPENHQQTLRERLTSVTEKRECWKCHRQMNPLGVTFEIFDDFGRYREDESLEAPENLIKKGNGKTDADVFITKPVDAGGVLQGTGESHLDGDVENAFDLIERLSRSERVRQSIIRHAFRFFMGRNEMLSDSKTLMEADRAYVESGGSFNAVVISLLTSDSFIYRKAPMEGSRVVVETLGQM